MLRLFLFVFGIAGFGVLIFAGSFDDVNKQNLGRSWMKIEDCRLVRNPANDGDSFHVRYDGNERIFRLCYVDCPETHSADPALEARVKEQAIHFGVSEDDVLKAGKEAGDFSDKILSKKFTVYTQWVDAKGASRYKRYYAIVVVDGKSLAELLVENGWARVHGLVFNDQEGTKGFDVRDKLMKLESEAKAKKVGIWK